MKINVSIEANSVEEAQAAFAVLLAGGAPAEPIVTTLQISPEPEPVKEQEKPKASRTKPKEAVQADPLASAPVAEPVTSTPAVDPLALTPAPTADPLADTITTAPTADPLADTITTADPLQSTGSTDVTFETLRAKIGKIAETDRVKVVALIQTFKKADGTPCERPSDLQEKDYATVYTDLDYI
jgi:hypothetical protein